MLQIGGRTRLYPVLGFPVRQVRAPALVNPVLAQSGTDAVVVPIEVAPENLRSVFAGLRHMHNVPGILVTVPHKIQAAALADRISRRAGICRSANVLRREEDGSWSADMLDGLGFVHGLSASGVEVRGLRVAVVGAGGAGAAIAVACLEFGAAQVSVHDIDPQRVKSLVQRLNQHWPHQAQGQVVEAAADLGGPDIAVNATALGLSSGDPLPFDPAQLPATSVVADIVMEPAVTSLLAAARATGRRTHPGEPTLHHQIAGYRDFFGWP